MNIIEKLGLQIYKKEFVFKKIIEELNLNQKNLYIGENDKNEFYFLILVRFMDVNEENFQKIKQFINLKSEIFINLKFIALNDEKSFYFAFQHHDLTFLQFANRNLSKMSFKNKLILGKQFIEIINITNINNLVISEYNPNMFFVIEKESSIILKYFYNGNLFF